MFKSSFDLTEAEKAERERRLAADLIDAKERVKKVKTTSRRWHYRNSNFGMGM